jgi:hypothetical protein
VERWANDWRGDSSRERVRRRVSPLLGRLLSRRLRVAHFSSVLIHLTGFTGIVSGLVNSLEAPLRRFRWVTLIDYAWGFSPSFPASLCSWRSRPRRSRTTPQAPAVPGRRQTHTTRKARARPKTNVGYRQGLRSDTDEGVPVDLTASLHCCAWSPSRAAAASLAVSALLASASPFSSRRDPRRAVWLLMESMTSVPATEQNYGLAHAKARYRMLSFPYQKPALLQPVMHA